MRIRTTVVVHFGLIAGWLTGGVYGAVIRVPGDQPTIAAAITAASPGDEILVAAGFTNIEDFTINKDNLWLRAEDGGATLQCVAGVGIAISANGVTIGGAAGGGFTIYDHSIHTTAVLQISAGVTDTTISYNTIGISGTGTTAGLTAAQTDRLTVAANTLIFPGSAVAITLDPAGTEVTSFAVTISDNQFMVTGSPASAQAVAAHLVGDLAIYNNTIQGEVRLSADNADHVQGIAIYFNTFPNAGAMPAGGPGIHFRRGTSVNKAFKNVVIAYNHFPGRYRGVVFDDNLLASNVDSATIRIKYNDFTGVQSEAIYGGELGGLPVVLIDAAYNWYGDASGPHNTTFNAAGKGSAVSDDVDFLPWLSEPPGTGPVGITGPQGPNGPPGPQGLAGSSGCDGTDGRDGGAGVNGQDGTAGADGEDGATGANGANGKNGLPCWDLDGDGIGDLAEDVNQDGNYDALDCVGAPGAPGASGRDGAQGDMGPPGSPGPSATGAGGLACGASLTNAYLLLVGSGLVARKLTGCHRRR